MWGDSHAGDFYNVLKLNNEFSKLDLEFLSYDYFYCFRDKSFNEKIIQFIKDNFISTRNCEEKIKSYYDGQIILRGNLLL